MFRKKILLRVATPFPLQNSFVDLQLTLQSDSPLSSSRSAEIETLCWRISRKFSVACIAEDGRVHIVHQRSQHDSAMEALEEIKRCLAPGVMLNIEKEVVRVSAFINRVIECSLRSMLLNTSWSCFDDGLNLFSRFLSEEEKNPVYSVQVTCQVAQVDAYDGLDFIISPDIVKFSRHKVTDLIESRVMHDFQSDRELPVDKLDILTVCSLLPSFARGHVIGICQSSPSVELVHDYEQRLYYKYGLELSAAHFLKVQYINGEFVEEQWFPSFMVLHGSGLMPVSQSIRASKLVSAIEHLTTALEAWNFFDGGPLKVKEIYNLDLGPDGCLWTKVSRNFPSHITLPVDTSCRFSSLCMANDYRTAKPPPIFVVPSQTCEPFKKIEDSEVMSVLAASCGTLSKEKTGFRPAFMNRKHSTRKTNIIKEKAHTLLSAGISESQNIIQNSPKSINIDQEKHALPKDAAAATCQKDKTAPNNTISMKNCNPTCDTTDGIIQKKELGKIPSKRRKVRDEQLVDKKHVCSQAENVDTIAKVIGHYETHQLDSLTVPELKSFLSSKKAKVGGRKEELVARVTAFLDLKHS